MVLNYPQAGYDGRGPRVPDMAPIDMIRSEYGSFQVNANSSSVILTIPSNKVFHVRTILIMSQNVNSVGTVGIIQRSGVAGTSTMWQAFMHLSFADSQNMGQFQTLYHNNIVGFLITASTTARKYVVARSDTISSIMWIGGIMRERNGNDTTT